MQTSTGSPTFAVAVIVGLLTLQLMHRSAECAPAEGLTPFGFLMGRSNDQPAEHPVMRFIAFKPSDGAKFRASFEKKHGPRGRDLIDSLGRGSYKTAADQKEELAISGGGTSIGKSSAVKGSIQKSHQLSKQ